MAPSPYGSIESDDPEKGGASAGPPSGFVGNEDAENRDNRDYSLGETYYLKDHGGNRWAKFLRALLPILIAAAIIGGLGYYFTRDFNHLYPGSGGEEGGGDHQHFSNNVVPVVVEDDAAAPAPAPASAPKDSGDGGASETKGTHGEGSHARSSNSCDAHEKCASLGLTGVCCPTNEGVTLGCCD